MFGIKPALQCHRSNMISPKAVHQHMDELEMHIGSMNFYAASNFVDKTALLLRNCSKAEVLQYQERLVQFFHKTIDAPCNGSYFGNVMNKETYQNHTTFVEHISNAFGEHLTIEAKQHIAYKVTEQVRNGRLSIDVAMKITTKLKLKETFPNLFLEPIWVEYEMAPYSAVYPPALVGYNCETSATPWYSYPNEFGRYTHLRMTTNVITPVFIEPV